MVRKKESWLGRMDISQKQILRAKVSKLELRTGGTEDYRCVPAFRELFMLARTSLHSWTSYKEVIKPGLFSVNTTRPPIHFPKLRQDLFAGNRNAYLPGKLFRSPLSAASNRRAHSLPPSFRTSATRVAAKSCWFSSTRTVIVPQYFHDRLQIFIAWHGFMKRSEKIKIHIRRATATNVKNRSINSRSAEDSNNLITIWNIVPHQICKN